MALGSKNKTISKKWQSGDSDFEWLKEQALNQDTLDIIDMIEQDETNFVNEGIVTEGREEFALHLKQGIFHTSRVTGHSIAHIFVHIFKNKEHRQVAGFEKINQPVIIDIGANEGYYALSMAKDTGAKVIAIEPNPIAYNFLLKNIESNGLIGVISPINSAVWSSRGVVDLNILPQVTSIGSITITDTSFMARAKDRVVKVPVQALTLADIIAAHDLTHVDLLKMDIEGGELEVLEANINCLDIVDRIVLEYHSQELKERLIKLLSRNGYELQHHAPDRPDFGDLYFKRARLPRPFARFAKLRYLYT